MKLITCHLDYLTNEQGIPQSHKRIFEVTNLKSKIDTMKPRDVAFHRLAQPSAGELGPCYFT